MAHSTECPGLHRLRVVLLMFVLFAGAGGQAPLWTRLVLVATAAAIPVAIAAQYGWTGVRALLGLSSRLRRRDDSVPTPSPINPSEGVSDHGEQRSSAAAR
ncbi:hypothetical protein [Micromonospora sp. WMMD964]|uniref:hypothetical protein n=1 Tax=Micromonospora sp. WMMD964 TaxID=3016091 RepID=UPI00249CC73A|nr:hypothetical protein [Micromonospora sp. WMMD964]WFE99969.1 hypothetical protein O7616_24185 [Micromonospora sp. WMMD964]